MEQGRVGVLQVPIGRSVLDSVGRAIARVEIVLLLLCGEVVGLDPDEDVLHVRASVCVPPRAAHDHRNM